MDSPMPQRTPGATSGQGPREDRTLDPEALTDPTGMDVDDLAARLAAVDDLSYVDGSLSDSILGQISVAHPSDLPSMVGMLHAAAHDDDLESDDDDLRQAVALGRDRSEPDPLAPDQGPRVAPLTFAGGPLPVIPGYHMIERLGRGATGTVFKAFAEATQRYVAIKLMEPRHMAQPNARARLQRELRLCTRLDHPGLARLLDSGVVAGLHYYVMELIDGPTLDRYAQQQSLSHEQIVHLMVDVCEAIEYTHQRGIVHRDLKPTNIVMDPTGRPRVIDFGLAKALIDDHEQIVSVEGQVTGTPAYMSPEQAAGRINDIDQRTDVYGLGTILFKLLTGQYAHKQEGTLKEILHRIALEPTRRAREFNPDIDERLEEILWRATASNQAKRFRSAGEMAASLRAYFQRASAQDQPAPESHEPPAWPVALVADKLGISESALRKWMQQATFGASVPTRRTEELEAENARLTRVVAEMAMEVHSLRDAARRR